MTTVEIDKKTETFQCLIDEVEEQTGLFVEPVFAADDGEMGIALVSQGRPVVYVDMKHGPQEALWRLHAHWRDIVMPCHRQCPYTSINAESVLRSLLPLAQWPLAKALSFAGHLGVLGKGRRSCPGPLLYLRGRGGTLTGTPKKAHDGVYFKWKKVWLLPRRLLVRVQPPQPLPGLCSFLRSLSCLLLFFSSH